MKTKQQLSLLLAVIGIAVFCYGWLSTPSALSFIELLQMEEALQQAYYNEADKATLMKLGGCLLVGIGLVSFVIIRSIRIHKKTSA